MIPLKTLGRIFAYAIGAVSAGLFTFVFYNEAFLNQGVRFIEPNLAIASLEFLLSIAGLAVMTVFLYQDVYQ